MELTSAQHLKTTYKPIFDDYHSTLDPIAFLLNSYADSITIKQALNALNKLDGIQTPRLPDITPDDEDFDFAFTSSSENDFTSDDE